MKLSEELDWMAKNWGVNSSRLLNCRDRAKQIEAASDELEMERATNARLAQERDELKAEVERLRNPKLLSQTLAESLATPPDPWAAFPPPPGEEWHNPHQLTPAQFGCHLNAVGSWRPITRTEFLTMRHKHQDSQFFDSAGIWDYPVYRGCAYLPHDTYRTRAKLPTKPDAPKRDAFELPHDFGLIGLSPIGNSLTALRNRIREIEAAQADIVARLERGGM